MEKKYYNPIRLVNDNEIPCPSVYEWSLQDISASDAGRTEDMVMQKKRIGQVVKLRLEWNNVSILDGAKILQAFDPEYINVEYLDAKEGVYVIKEFYVDDRTSPLYNSKLGVWSKIAFDIIQRGAK